MSSPFLGQFRLVHVVAFTLLACVGIPLALMGGAMVWQLQRGFDQYLQNHDAQRLERMVQLLEQDSRAPGEPAWLQRPWPQTLRGLSRQLRMEDDGMNGQHSFPARPLGERLPHDEVGHGPPQGEFSNPPPLRDRGPGGRPGPLDSLERRITLLDPQGRILAGPRPEPGVPSVRQAVRGHDGVVAYVQLRVVRALPDALGQRFLREQMVSILGLAAVLLVSAGLLAIWLARRVARPLQAVTDTASRIASGDLATRVLTDAQGMGVAELDALMHHINQMAQSLETQQHRQKRWIADISHELRTPLAVLQAEVEALIDGVRVNDLAAMQSLREELLRMAALVQDLHLLSLADLHALPCDFQEGDAWDCVSKAVQRFELRAQLAGIRLQCHRSNAQALMVVWDFQRMAQVLGNLVDNSLNYTQQPGSTDIQLHSVGADVQIIVEDSAPGVRDDDLLKLLDPLYRAQLHRARPQGRGQSGSGLGLSIVQVLVQAHGGHVNVMHSAQGGLKVILTLPKVARP